MSGGGRRGEVRKRKAAPERKVTGGAHNRKARRAAAATAPRKLSADEERQIAARIRARFERMRLERKAFWETQTADDILSMRLRDSARECAGLGGAWFLGLLIEAVPRWVHRHRDTDPAAREQRAHALAETLAYSQGAAAIVDADAGCSEDGEIARVFNAIAEGVALGAFVPGGALFYGVQWTVIDRVLRITNNAFCGQYRLDDDALWA